jgi:hypothetical protein
MWTYKSIILDAGASILIALTLASPAMAQATRAEIIEKQQEEKAGKTHAYEPPKGERIFLAVKKNLIDSPSGLYPLFGSVYGGGGLGMGGGFRQYYGDRTFWDVKGLWSIRNYKLGEVSTDSQGHAHNRIDLRARIGWRDAPQVAYYGQGPDTALEDRVNFRFKQTYAGGSVKARPISWVSLGAALDLEAYETDSGLGAFPSIETAHTSLTAPGLGSSPTYLHSIASAGIDWRPSPGYARSGGLYEGRFHRYRDRDDQFSFDRLEAEIVQHIPLLRENWVISLRGLAASTQGNTPYFLLPSLGSADTLRGYPVWRFRDRHSLLLQGEFRWIPNRLGLDMAVFWDAGKVADRRRALDLKGLVKDTGIEARFHGPSVTALRLGMAHGTEGWRAIFGGSAAF